MIIIKPLEIAVWLYLQAIRTNCNDNTTQFCAQFYEENLISSQTHEGLEEDSILDLVQKQYLSFPFPYVGSQHIQMEKSYFQSVERDIPISTYPSLDLEMVNHYIYQGESGNK